MRGVTRALAVLVALVTGCGAESTRVRASARAARPAPLDAGTRDSQADAAQDPLPSAARIAESGESIAPGMREAARIDGDAPLEQAIVRGAERDTCARVAFAARAPIRVALVDGSGATLADTPRAESGVSGTACVRRGDALIARFAGEEDAGKIGVRAVAWVSP